MTYSASALHAHAQLSNTSVRFLQEVAGKPAWHRRDSFEELEGAIPDELQPWPTFLGNRCRERFEMAAAGLFGLLKAMPRRLYAEDRTSFDTLFPYLGPDAIALLDDHRYLDALITRGDFLLTDSGLKCLEFNVNAGLGGWDMVFVVPRLFGHSLFQELACLESTEVSAPNPVARFFDHIVRCDAFVNRDPRHVAIAIPGLDAESESLAVGYQFYLQHEYSQAESRAGRSGGQVSLVKWGALSYLEEHGTWRGPHGDVTTLVQLWMPFIRDPRIDHSIRSRTTAVLNGPLAEALNDKRLLALLSDPERTPLPTAERNLVDEYLPWTRPLHAASSRYREAEGQVLDIAARARENFVLKPATDFGGWGVTVGAETSQAEWDDALREASAEGTWLVQERLESAPFVYQSGEEGTDEHNVAWGVFLVGGAYSGTTARVLPRSAGAVVNVKRGAEKSLVIEVDD